MKVYISVDLEGISGTTSWEATNPGHFEHSAAAHQMTLEAVAACEGALRAGATEIYVKDAHDSGRNMDLSLFPKEAKVIFDWTNSPESMIGGINPSFDAVMYIGYHSPAGINGNPLAHTMNRGNNYVKINGRLASEFLIHAYCAEEIGVPSVFISGDKKLCHHAAEYNPEMVSAAVKDGLGSATINLAPAAAQQLIRSGAEQGLLKRTQCHITLPETFTLEINFKEHAKARRASYYPGVVMIDDYTVSYSSDKWSDVMTARMFIL